MKKGVSEKLFTFYWLHEITETLAFSFFLFLPLFFSILLFYCESLRVNISFWHFLSPSLLYPAAKVCEFYVSCPRVERKAQFVTLLWCPGLSPFPVRLSFVGGIPFVFSPRGAFGFLVDAFISSSSFLLFLFSYDRNPVVSHQRRSSFVRLFCLSCNCKEGVNSPFFLPLPSSFHPWLFLFHSLHVVRVWLSRTRLPSLIALNLVSSR